MGCRRAFEIDLPAFLADARRPEFAGFLEHYPRCHQCSAEVRAWTEVHRLLEAGGKGADRHPAADLLLAFEDAPGTLPATRRAALEAHLGRCRSCADELRALRRMDVSSVEERAAEPAGGRRPGLGRLLSGLWGLARHPALAYALVLLLLYPALRGVLERPVGSTGESGRPGVAGQPGVAGGAPRAAAEGDRGDAAAPPREQRPPGDERQRAPAPSGRKGPAAAGAETPAAKAPAPAAPAAPGKTDTARAEGTIGTGGGTPAASAPAGRAESFGLVGPSPSRYAARGEKAAEVPPAPRVVPLRPGEPVDVPLAAFEEGLTLRVRLPDARRDAGAIEVRVLDPDARREVRERFRPSPGQAHLDVRLPAEWLSPGTYRVELSAVGAGGAATRVADFAFTVR